MSRHSLANSVFALLALAPTWSVSPSRSAQSSLCGTNASAVVTIIPAYPAYTHGTPGSDFSSSPDAPTRRSTVSSAPLTEIGRPDPGLRTPANSPASSYTVTCCKSLASSTSPGGRSPGPLASPRGRNVAHALPGTPPAPSVGAMGSFSSLASASPGSFALTDMAAMPQSVWYAVTPPNLSGSLTNIVFLASSAPRPSTTDRSEKNCETSPLG
mmetsp:Transcript_12785/g.44425  ORF Transcript_12785/g.44425 Transcript_12785/m.44425 type:complete len:213 (+) Transcript_12785:970-1608(+)